MRNYKFIEAEGCIGHPSANNTYATLPATNPLFQGFSRYQNVNKEIINFTIQNVSGRFRDAYYIPGLLFWDVFCMKSGVRICVFAYSKLHIEGDTRTKRK